MVIAALILMISTGLLFFYVQAICEKVLRRGFDREYAHIIVNANRLEFPSIRMSLQQFAEPVDYPLTRMMLKCDFLALTYLLKNAVNVDRRYSHEERMLSVYFRFVFFVFTVLHALGFQEKKAVLKLTSILQYFANVIGQRVSAVRFGNLTATDYLLSL